MKSLEMVNKLSKATWYDQETDTLITYISKDMLNQIQQSLEVLEIIRKKEVNISYLKQYFDDKIFTLKDIHYLTTLNNMYLTMEELLKLKQWLEVNEE